MVRLNRFIASCTEYSRRQADAFIKRGQVKVNGKVVTNLATQVDIDDKVELNGKLLTPQRLVYYLVNKPVGYVCSLKDKHAKHLVVDLVPKNPPVFPVGRLDKDSRGLIILTNDGELAYQLTHPKFSKEKEYYISLNKEIGDKDQKRLLQGIKLPAGMGKFDLLEKIDYQNLDKWQKFYIKGMQQPVYRVIIHQGLKRQIREMLKEFNYQVQDLLRVRIASINLWDLPTGKYRRLSRSDIIRLIR